MCRGDCRHGRRPACRQPCTREDISLPVGLLRSEVPLILAIAFGLVAWFGMRQAVIVSANDVDTPGNIGSFDRLVKLFPDVAMAYYLRGERYLAESDFQHAHADLDRAIELDGNFAASYLARGRVLIQEGSSGCCRG